MELREVTSLKQREVTSPGWSLREVASPWGSQKLSMGSKHFETASHKPATDQPPRTTTNHQVTRQPVRLWCCLVGCLLVGWLACMHNMNMDSTVCVQLMWKLVLVLEE